MKGEGHDRHVPRNEGIPNTTTIRDNEVKLEISSIQPIAA